MAEQQPVSAALELPAEWFSFRQSLKVSIANKLPQLDDNGRIAAGTLASVMPAQQALQVKMIHDLITSAEIPHLATEASFPVICVFAEALKSIGVDMNVVFGVLLSFALKQVKLCTSPLRELAPSLEWWDEGDVAQDEHMAIVNSTDLSKLKHRENAWALMASLAARGYANAHTIIKAAMMHPEPFMGFIVYAFTHYAFALKTLSRRAIGDGHDAHNNEELTVDGHGFFFNEVIAHRSFIQHMLLFDKRAGLQSKLLSPADPMAIKLPKSDTFLIHDFHLTLCLEKWLQKLNPSSPFKILAMTIMDWILRTPQRDKQVFQLYLYMEDRRLQEEVLKSVIDVNAG